MLTAKGPSDMLRLLALVAATCTFFLSVSAASVSVKRNNFGNGKGKSSSRPNFVYIISDDQDAYTANPKYMPQLSKHIAHHGSNYTNFFTPVSLYVLVSQLERIATDAASSAAARLASRSSAASTRTITMCVLPSRY